jgi:hypothetical protein
MSQRPRWLRADLLVAIAIVVAIAVALLSPRWRANPSKRPTLDLPNRRPEGIDPAKLERHGSPFDDAVTARAESLCVRMAESQLGFALKQPVTIDVQDRYGTGNEDDGRGVYLIFEGLALTPSGRASVFRCTAKSLGDYPGTPLITHVERR